jgi:ubiquitin-protein ligase
MNTARVWNEVNAIKDKYRTEYNMDDREVIVKNVRFPDGWRPQRVDVVLELPNTYPQQPPTVYIPDDVEYLDEKTRRPHILLSTSFREGCYKLCLHDFAWEPSHHTMISILKLLMEALRSPRSGSRKFETRANA